MAKAKTYPSSIDLNKSFKLINGVIHHNGRLNDKPVGVSVTEKGYQRIYMRRRPLMVHRVIWKMVNGYDPIMIDHINRDRKDNRIENLRECTQTENLRNCRSRGGKSKYKGVTTEGNKWRAMIKVNGKSKRLGSFNTQEEAANAYDLAANDLFGEFALTNLDLGLY